VPNDGLKGPIPNDGLKGPIPNDGLKGPIPSDGVKSPIPEDGLKVPVPNDGEDYLKVKLTELLVTSVQSGSPTGESDIKIDPFLDVGMKTGTEPLESGPELPAEQFSLTYSTIDLTYNPGTGKPPEEHGLGKLLGGESEGPDQAPRRLSDALPPDDGEPGR
jgi:hypothetical protein